MIRFKVCNDHREIFWIPFLARWIALDVVMQLKKALSTQHPPKFQSPHPVSSCLLSSVSVFPNFWLLFSLEVSFHDIIFSWAKRFPHLLTALLYLYKAVHPNDHRGLLTPLAEGKSILILCFFLIIVWRAWQTTESHHSSRDGITQCSN